MPNLDGAPLTYEDCLGFNQAAFDDVGNAVWYAEFLLISNAKKFNEQLTSSGITAENEGMYYVKLLVREENPKNTDTPVFEATVVCKSPGDENKEKNWQDLVSLRAEYSQGHYHFVSGDGEEFPMTRQGAIDLVASVQKVMFGGLSEDQQDLLLSQSDYTDDKLQASIPTL